MSSKKLRFQDYKNCLEAAEIGNKINHSENNKLILKTQQRFSTEKHNVFTEKINEIALSSNDDKQYNQLIR